MVSQLSIAAVLPAHGFAICCCIFLGSARGGGLLREMEALGASVESLVTWLQRRADERTDRKIAAQARAQREAIVEHAKQEMPEHEPVMVIPAAADVPKSERAVKERQRPLFQE